MDTITNLHEILESKSIVKGSSNDVPYPSAADLLNPIIDIFGSENLSFFATHPESIGNDQNEILTAYGRAGAIKTIEINEELNYSIGYMYALDLAKPVLKVFSGVNVKICSNMCIFNFSNMEKYEYMVTGKKGAIEKVKEYYNRVDADIENAKKIINDLRKMEFSEKEVQNLLGDFLTSFQVVKNYAGVNCIANAAKLLKDKKTHYYYENFTSGWNIYNAITDYFGKKAHIIDHPEKVYFVYEKFVEHCKKNNIPFGDQPKLLE